MKKVIIIVYAISAILTGVGAVIFPQFVDISLFSALPLIAALYMGIGAACMYYFGEFNRHTLSRRLFSFDFKYSKQGGDSKFDFVAERGEKVGYSIPVLIYVIISAIAFPFIFFFSFYVKIGFALAVLIISPIIQLVGVAKEMSQKIKNDLYRSEFEKKELDAQKKREEMGKWK